MTNSNSPKGKDDGLPGTTPQASGGVKASPADHLRGTAAWLAECTEGVTGIYGTIAEDRAALLAGARALDCLPDLLEALQFYADLQNWHSFIARPPGRDSHYHSAHAHLDAGERARAALSKATSQTEPGQ